MEIEIQLLPFMGTSRRVLELLTQGLAAVGVHARVLPERLLPTHAYNPHRDQYVARAFLHLVKSAVNDTTVLGVADVDIYVEGLNFVFGLAESPGKAAFISVFRLHENDQALFEQRLIKEAMHELGHTLGLSHCNNPDCVMFFSNGLRDTDRKDKNYCRRCREKLKEPF